MAQSNFTRLRVYQLSESVADAIWDSVLRWPILARDTVGKQIIRSADSIGANIAKGAGRGTYRDNRRFIMTARGSLYEAQHWLRRAFKRDLLNDKQVKTLKPLLDELAPKLNAFLRSLGARESDGSCD
jgi:four helix bundle protein